MFIKLTRLDSTPIWINAHFVVTVEPRRLGGATVVPIGDGLDYDVRETPEQVLAMLAAVPAPAVQVVPVPAPDALAPTPPDVSPEADPEPLEGGEPEAGEVESEEKGERKNAKAKKVRAKAAAKRPESPPEPPRPKGPPPDFPDDQVDRLRKMAPGSMKKLLNTLATQFQPCDPQAVAQMLEARGVFALDRDRVQWAQPQAAPAAEASEPTPPAPVGEPPPEETSAGEEAPEGGPESVEPPADANWIFGKREPEPTRTPEPESAPAPEPEPSAPEPEPSAEDGAALAETAPSGSAEPVPEQPVA